MPVTGRNLQQHQIAACVPLLPRASVKLAQPALQVTLNGYHRVSRVP